MKERLKVLREFYTKLAAVTNKQEGASPQLLLRKCRSGQKLKLVRDPLDMLDKNAIKVCLSTGEQLGWINKDLAQWSLAEDIDRGTTVEAEISEVTGGTFSKLEGCNIKITVYATRTGGRGRA
ncbi:MAG: HIRAN domain-containing protein [Spirochaetia bacterium]